MAKKKEFPYPKRAPEGHVPVPACDATPEMLEGWGIPVKKSDKSMGTERISREGYPFWPEAVSRATIAGFLRTPTPEEQKAHDEARLAKWKESQQVDPEMLVYYWTILRPEDRERYIREGKVTPS